MDKELSDEDITKVLVWQALFIHVQKNMAILTYFNKINTHPLPHEPH
jgi:hypothetical protein